MWVWGYSFFPKIIHSTNLDQLDCFLQLERTHMWKYHTSLSPSLFLSQTHIHCADTWIKGTLRHSGKSACRLSCLELDDKIDAICPLNMKLEPGEWVKLIHTKIKPESNHSKMGSCVRDYYLTRCSDFLDSHCHCKDGCEVIAVGQEIAPHRTPS